MQGFSGIAVSHRTFLLSSRTNSITRCAKSPDFEPHKGKRTIKSKNKSKNLHIYQFLVTLIKVLKNEKHINITRKLF